jgi:hypothetical protein
MVSYTSSWFQSRCVDGADPTTRGWCPATIKWVPCLKPNNTKSREISLDPWYHHPIGWGTDTLWPIHWCLIASRSPRKEGRLLTKEAGTWQVQHFYLSASERMCASQVFCSDPSPPFHSLICGFASPKGWLCMNVIASWVPWGLHELIKPLVRGVGDSKLSDMEKKTSNDKPAGFE